MTRGKAYRLFCKMWIPYQNKFKYRWKTSEKLMTTESLLIKAVQLMQKSFDENQDYLASFFQELGIEMTPMGPPLTVYISDHKVN